MVILMLICSLLVCSGLSAQKPMNFDEALATMLANNKALEAAQQSVAAAELEQRAAQGLRWPRIDLFGAYLHLQQDISVDLGGAKGAITESVESLISKGVSGGLISPDAGALIGDILSPLISGNWRYNLQQRSLGSIFATLEMPIYTGGRINIINRVASLNTDAANIELSAINSGLLVTLVERYYGAILAKELYNVRVEALRSIEQHLSDANAMYEEGMLQHSVILYLEYKVSEAQRDKESAQHQLEIARLALKSLLNIDYDIEPSLNLFVCNNIYDVGYYIDNAIKLNPIICEVNVEKRLAEEGVKLARAALLPEIVAMGATSIYNYQVSNMLPRWFVGVGLNVTLFDGLAKERRLRAAKATAIGIDNIVENTKSDIVLIVEKEYFNMLNEKQNIDAVERSVTFADEYYHTVYSAFIEGVMSATDVTTAQVELSIAKVECLNAAYNYCVSLAKLLEAAGLASTFSDYVKSGKYIDID